MNTYADYINRFFDELEVYDDLERGHSNKVYLHQAVLSFVEDNTKLGAFGVYDAFFDCYRIVLEGDTNAFIDLLDVMRSYEEHAALLIDYQRDHYVHSVNVFVLGLAIYIQNDNYQEAFVSSVRDRTGYRHAYRTRHEEFFYRWGIASLFHDVAYPIEIIGKQFDEFIEYAAAVDGPVSLRSHLGFEDFDALNQIPEVMPRDEFTASFLSRAAEAPMLDPLRPLDLLAWKLDDSLDLGLSDVRAVLSDFPSVMADRGFIDHGYFSAIILLRWYGYLVQACRYNPEYFFQPILDSASAILLHNFYRNVITKAPFDRGPLDPADHPIGFLLILCDELQEWSREGYGRRERDRAVVGQAVIRVSSESLDATYLVESGALSDGFVSDKEALVLSLLDIETLFGAGLTITVEAGGSVPPTPRPSPHPTTLIARPLLEHVERLAEAVHDFYNQRMLDRHPDVPLEHPTYADLPDSLKYSNLRQARSIHARLGAMGLTLGPADAPGVPVTTIPDETVERLAEAEHDEWVRERRHTGWVLGPEKDVDAKVTPLLIPYAQLAEDVKEQDRDAIRSIPSLVASIGLALYAAE
jgi:hypothetical protein